MRSPEGEEVAVVAHLEEPLAAPAAGLRGAGNGAPSGKSSVGATVGFADIFGEDPQVVATKLAAERFARTRLPILLLAETGTGKDLLARAIHGASPRRDRPFVAINCGALSPHLLESELFGYAPGAFTDARREGHEGKVGAARGGTLFLDEVAEMPGPLQALLLRVLEDGTYFRVGENVPRQADVRLVCATCRDLPGMVEDGSFRRDLFFRIAGATLSMPPVAERTDVAGLARHVFARLVATEAPGAKHQRLSRAVLHAICTARWPGNVRQLRSALQYALALAEEDELRPEHLPRLDAARTSDDKPRRREPGERLDEMEQLLVARAVEEAGGNLSQAARRLGIARSTLYRHLRREAAADTGASR
jgi:transcriptional regulator with PAS, ATPase and Fis domain